MRTPLPFQVAIMACPADEARPQAAEAAGQTHIQPSRFRSKAMIDDVALRVGHDLIPRSLVCGRAWAHQRHRPFAASVVSDHPAFTAASTSVFIDDGIVKLVAVKLMRQGACKA
jgi:hypothetical protein